VTGAVFCDVSCDVPCAVPDAVRRSDRGLAARRPGLERVIPQHIQRPPPRVQLSGTLARARIEVGSAPAAQALAVLPAERREGQLEEERVSDQRPKVQLIPLQGVGVLVEVIVAVAGMAGVSPATVWRAPAVRSSGAAGAGRVT
jgi:hypothetical protein